jgi:hypothetical protein
MIPQDEILGAVGPSRMFKGIQNYVFLTSTVSAGLLRELDAREKLFEERSLLILAGENEDPGGRATRPRANSNPKP